MLKNLTRAKEMIHRARSIIVAGHVNPDGDSIGSLLSLGLGLERLGKHVTMISTDGIPRRYRLLPGARRVAERATHRADLAIAVDCSNKEILGDNYNAFITADRIIEIDHHDFRRSFGDIALIDTGASAVGEIIYALLRELGVRVTPDIAQNLITSIIVETNSFRSPSVRPFTFRTCADLMDAGVNFPKLVDILFWSRRKEAVILSSICMARCKFVRRGRLVWSIIRKKDFETVRGKDEDIDAVPDRMRSIRHVEIAVLFREKDKETLRVSLRSKGKINVAGVAEYYRGGGHYDIAGCTIPNDEKAIQKLLRQAERLLA